jgi:hypothetical protein
MSNKYKSINAKNLWYNLLIDDDLYSGTSTDRSILIDKNINDLELIKKIDNFKMVYDNDLNLKIKELYG